MPLQLTPIEPNAPVEVECEIPEAVSGRGNGEGRSSTFREWGLRKGPVVMGRLLLVDAKGPLTPVPRLDVEEKGPSGGRPFIATVCGVGGGDVPPPSLLRSLRVIGGRECESSEASFGERRSIC